MARSGGCTSEQNTQGMRRATMLHFSSVENQGVEHYEGVEAGHYRVQSLVDFRPREPRDGIVYTCTETCGERTGCERSIIWKHFLEIEGDPTPVHPSIPCANMYQASWPHGLCQTKSTPMRLPRASKNARRHTSTSSTRWGPTLGSRAPSHSPRCPPPAARHP
jgi:hypothetical protein